MHFTFQWTVAGRHGLCGLIAPWAAVWACRSEPTPASTRHHGTTGLTAKDQQEKHRSVTLLPAWVCKQELSLTFQYVVACLNLTLLAISPTDDLCPWSPWSPCSRSCGAGSVSRRRVCVCEAAGDTACPAEIEAERNSEETQLCYKQPCPGTQGKTAGKHTVQQIILLVAECVIEQQEQPVEFKTTQRRRRLISFSKQAQQIIIAGKGIWSRSAGCILTSQRFKCSFVISIKKRCTSKCVFAVSGWESTSRSTRFSSSRISLLIITKSCKSRIQIALIVTFLRPKVDQLRQYLCKYKHFSHLPARVDTFTLLL